MASKTTWLPSPIPKAVNGFLTRMVRAAAMANCGVASIVSGVLSPHDVGGRRFGVRRVWQIGRGPQGLPGFAHGRQSRAGLGVRGAGTIGELTVNAAAVATPSTARVAMGSQVFRDMPLLLRSDRALAVRRARSSVPQSGRAAFVLLEDSGLSSAPGIPRRASDAPPG